MTQDRAAARAGEYVVFGAIRCFKPASLPPSPPIEFSQSLISALSQADRALARLDGAASSLPSPDLLVYAFMRQEAALSSQIEGTQATLEDLFEFEAVPEAVELRTDVRDIVRYIEAINWGIATLDTIPISKRLLRGLHKRLLAEGRGSSRNPGEFRDGQNFIGPPGCAIEEATFVPPAAPLMLEALDDWERYVHNRKFPTLVDCAIIHAQFETIHPFWDGNGRLGRMIITLILCSDQILQNPILYLSLFFKECRDEYYRRLQAIRDTGDWEGWIEFFLRGVTATCRTALVAVRTIVELREALVQRAHSLSRSANLARLVDALFQQPYVTVPLAADILGTSYQGASNIIGRLCQAGILEIVRDAPRGRIFAFRPYLEVLHRTASDLSGALESGDYLKGGGPPEDTQLSLGLPD